ncbi:protein of unknown function (plasmid) [Candidatus Promineifilum breve]|uniref:Helix-turn-helix domain-containing protein n=1 Tax=Candidatus Promineifilum breve TaxID=1806508 RepID=A0A161K3Z9_9CHLR|nr:helix-turn-helix domain-containing protein [Candidatus Promineifilum breve]CUS06447.1 protein of unknown function [Candidatus Promineifilum breve]
MKKKYLTIKELANAIGVAPATVTKWIRDGKVIAYQVGPYELSPYRIPASEAERVIREYGPPVESKPTPA